MKKLILVLAIALMACPAWAVLTVDLVEVDSDTVAVHYSGADAANLPRAFALKLTIDGTGEFTAVTATKTGESTAAAPGFGIFPGRIQFNETGGVDNYGSPLAADDSVGTTDQTLPSKEIVLEFGSLYYGDANAPETSGTLCTIDFTPGTATAIVMEDELTYRGGLVFEDGTQGDVYFSFDVTPPVVLPGQATNPSPANGGTGVYNLTLSWTAGSNATSRDVYFGTVNPPVTKVVADGTAVTYAPGSLWPTKTYYWRVDEKNAGGTTAGNVWSFTVSAPACYGYMAFACGDATGDSKVNAMDLLRVKNAWGKAAPDPAYNPCADFNKTGSVNAVDLLKVKQKWGQTLTTCP